MKIAYEENASVGPKQNQPTCGTKQYICPSQEKDGIIDIMLNFLFHIQASVPNLVQ